MVIIEVSRGEQDDVEAEMPEESSVVIIEVSGGEQGCGS